MHKVLKRVIFVVFLIFMFVVNSFIVYAYDLNAKHDVNMYYDKPEEIAKIQKNLWGEMRTWGITEAGCAGIIGNIMAESGCDYTRTQSDTPWESFVKGGTGLGLTQWTYPTRQDQLFATADELSKQWNTLEAQAAQLKKEIGEGGGYYMEILYSSDDVNKCSDTFLEVYERPLIYNYDARRQLAKTVYEQLKGTPPKSLDGGIEGTTNSNETTVTDSHIASIVSEWELTGMKGLDKKLKDNQSEVILPTNSDLSIKEQYSVALSGENIALEKYSSYIDIVRVIVVFIGLCLVLLGVFLIVALIFDKANNFIEISLVSIVTFGLLKYSDEKNTKRDSGYASATKIIIIVSVVMTIGLLLISGSVLPFTMRAIEWVVNLFIGGKNG